MSRPDTDDTFDADLAIPREALLPAVPDRYELRGPLGKGGFGTVYSGVDRLSGRSVAIKVVRCTTPAARTRLTREIAALRLLRIPGVVELLDDGAIGDSHFFVMALVEGAPFPGAAAAATARDGCLPWSAIEEVTRELLEILARVHATGVLHRDLKPENILVDTAGRVVVLDFGLAMSADLDDGLTRTGTFVGTPRYLAPEQIRGESVDARADLYAVGLLLYELLSGRQTLTANDGLASYLARRLSTDPSPIGELNPAIPTVVASVVDRLVQRDRSRRPSSAEETLRLLDGGVSSDSAALPWLGTRRALERAEKLLRAGRTVRITAPSGGGKSRFVSELEASLIRAGVPTFRLLPAQSPFASLGPHRPPAEAHHTLRDVTEAASQSVGSLRSDGTILIVDDEASVDPWTLALVDDVARSGGVLTSGASSEGVSIALTPLTAADLIPLFGGSELLLHQRSDAAHALWRRSGGHPRAVVDTLTDWRRRGIAAARGELVVVSRLALDQLGRESPSSRRSLGRARREVNQSQTTSSMSVGLPELRARVLDWLAVSYPSSTIALVAKALDLPIWRTEAELERLRQDGRVELDHDGAFLAYASPGLSIGTDYREAAHGRLASALPAESRTRLRHWVAAGDVENAVKDAIELADGLVGRGQSSEALGVLQDVFPLVRSASSVPANGGADSPQTSTSMGRWTRQLAVSLAEACASQGTSSSFALALYELARIPGATDLDALLRALRECLQAPSRAALDALKQAGAASTERFETLRLVTAIRTARAVSTSDVDEWMTLLAAHVHITGSPRAEAEYGLASAQSDFVGGRFDSALDRYRRVAELDVPQHTRLKALIGASASALETFKLGIAARLAGRAVALAVELRLPLLEGQARWLSRTASYRKRSTADIDIALVEACAAVESPDLEALICTTEAPVAWRLGNFEEAARLADVVRSRWSAIGRHAEVQLYDLLFRVSSNGGQAGPDGSATVEKALGHPIAGFGIQMLGLLSELDPDAVTAIPTADIDRLARQLPRRHWDTPLDVLTVNEALKRLGRPLRGGS